MGHWELGITPNYLDQFLAMSNDKPLLYERLRQRVYANILLIVAIAAVLVASAIPPQKLAVEPRNAVER
jgi:hypothetical protein